MLFILEDFQPLIVMNRMAEQSHFFTETLLLVISESMSTKNCTRRADSAECRSDSEALPLKLIAIASILLSGAAGVSAPLIGNRRRHRLFSTDGDLFFAAKAFAAGVILATGFVHMLPDASSALSDPCLPRRPWSRFPFSGFVSMMAALVTLLADFAGTQYYERKEERRRRAERASEGIGGVDSVFDSVSESGIVPVERVVVGVKEEVSGVHIVGMHAHSAEHAHSHVQGKGTCGRHVVGVEDGHGHGHGHGHGGRGGGEGEGVRHVVVSQILELGIVSHSVIIGLSLGVSHSPCTIRPLIAALSFHQFFEGFALGGCISQSQFSSMKTTLMACFFAATTPAGIAVGAAIASSYNNNSPRALAVEGILDSISAGILVYMSLVDLIAADFMSKKMSCNVRLQIVSYLALFLGAGMMSLLALWA
ncbi:hypothetical protein Syun_026355 [Stephania yunnanensis]|uniref:Uncharacterized protein n=1 Tax=Stephania yunnanensis TaxID=152371 RepID=A0AAP0ETF1_9MAGN